MRQDSKKTKWAFDTRPDDGGPARPVYIGNMEDWDAEETKRKRWTRPITPGATKATHGQPTFAIARYRCCHDLEKCGVRVKVRQGSVNAWNFAREWDYGFRHASRHSCINKRQYTGESRFHLMTKLSIARVLRTERWGRHYNIRNEEVHVEKYIGDIKPDVHFITKDNQTIIIEVVVTNDANRYKHDTFGRNMVLINLRNLGVTDDDSTFDRWVKAGGIEQILQEELDLNRRIELYNQRVEHFDQVDQAEWERKMRQFESKCREKFGFGLSSMNLDIKDFANEEEIELALLGEKKRRDLLRDLEAAETQLEFTYGEKLDLSLSDFTSVDELKEVYRKELGEKLKKKRERQEREKEIIRKEELRSYVKEMYEKHLRGYGRDFIPDNVEFDSKKEVDSYFARRVKQYGTYKDEYARCEKKYLFFSKNIPDEKSCSLAEMENPDALEPAFEAESQVRTKIDRWHEELAEQYGFSMWPVYSIEDSYIEKKDQLDELYSSEVPKRKKRLDSLLNHLENRLSGYIERYPFCEELSEYNFDRFVTPENAELLQDEKAGKPFLRQFDREVESIIQEGGYGIPGLENKVKEKIAEVKEVIQNSPTLQLVAQTEDLAPILYADLVKQKFGYISGGISFPKDPTKSSFERFRTISNHHIETLDKLVLCLLDEENDIKMRRNSILERLGTNGEEKNELHNHTTFILPLIINKENMLHSLRETNLKFTNYDDPDLALSGLVNTYAQKLELVSKILDCSETLSAFRDLISATELVRKQWNSFIGDVRGPYFSPEIEPNEVAILRAGMYGFIQSLSGEHVEDIMTGSGVITKATPIEKRIEIMGRRARRGALRDIDNIQQLQGYIRMKYDSRRQKLLSFAGPELNKLKNLLIECDKISTSLEKHKHMLKGVFIDFNTKRSEVYRLINSFRLLRDFPRIERKENLLIQPEMRIFDYSIQRLNRIVREKSLMKDRNARIPQYVKAKAPSEIERKLESDISILVDKCKACVEKGNELDACITFLSEDDSRLVALIQAVRENNYNTIASRLKFTVWKDEIIPIWSRLKLRPTKR